MKKTNNDVAYFFGIPTHRGDRYWYWPERKVACFFHDAGGPDIDEKKVNEFRKEGYTVRFFDDNQASDFESIDNFCKQLREDLRLPDATKELDRYEGRRREVVKALFGVE